MSRLTAAKEAPVRITTVFKKLLGLQGTSVRDVEVGVDAIVVDVASRRRRHACPRCPFSTGAGYDHAERQWRHVSLGKWRVMLRGVVWRLACPTHGVITESVPWADHESKFTRDFEDLVAWLTREMNKTAITRLVHITWATVGHIAERVANRYLNRQRLADLFQIGIDEVSYRKGHRYLTVVVDHDTGRLIWAQAGRDEKTLRKFFRALKKEGRAGIQLVSADAASWIGKVVREMCPDAVLCIDPFHVVAWATKALDEVRRGMWNELRDRGETARANAMKGSRWALVKNPEDLTRKQKRKLRAIEEDNQRLFKSYLMKEQLRDIFKTKGSEATYMLDAWLGWVGHSKNEPFKKVARAIKANRDGIDAALVYGLSNARLEASNTKLKLLTRMAFGFHSHAPLIALAMLKLGGLCPPLPRAT